MVCLAFLPLRLAGWLAGRACTWVTHTHLKGFSPSPFTNPSRLAGGIRKFHKRPVCPLLPCPASLSAGLWVWCARVFGRSSSFVLDLQNRCLVHWGVLVNGSTLDGQSGKSSETCLTDWGIPTPELAYESCGGFAIPCSRNVRTANIMYAGGLNPTFACLFLAELHVHSHIFSTERQPVCNCLVGANVGLTPVRGSNT